MPQKPEGMVVLGIETSCDETSAAVVVGGRAVLSNIISSQVSMHQRFGGVVPEVASRKHVEMVIPVIEEALSAAGTNLGNIDAIAVTKGPGLVGGLLVGLSAAKALAWANGLPIIGVNHIEGHISANYLSHHDLVPPAICLTVSGGHTELLFVRDFVSYEVLGRTRDDAAGEAFDKVARVLGLGYPGGPYIDKLSVGCDSKRYDLPRSLPGTWDFSFSGLKTAVLNIITAAGKKGDEISVGDLAASFQSAVVDVLVARTISAAETHSVEVIMLSGGVAANNLLRASLKAETDRRGWALFYPPLDLCTDNAAMIACAGYYQLQAGNCDGMGLNAVANLRLGSS